MSSRLSIEETLMSTYAARVRGDVEGTMAGFADDATFEFNGRGTGAPNFAAPIQGKAALWPVMRELIDSFPFSDWRVVSLLIDGEQAPLHWRATVAVKANGKVAEFDVFDLVTFRDGKIAKLHQSTDTAMIVSMLS